MKSTRLLFAAIASMAAASATPVLAQDPHGHDAAAAAPQTATTANCPVAGAGMGPQAMNSSGMGQMSQGMMGGQMMQMMQQMQQMHTEMMSMHKEMMQMHQDMRRRR